MLPFGGMTPTRLFAALLAASLLACAARQKQPIETAESAPATPPKAIDASVDGARSADASGDDLSGPFGPIYYALDSASLDSEDLAMLDRLADALRKQPDATVTISGHTCELGTAEYNLALGQKRAASAQRYLVQLGVAPERISVVSYGEERPAVTGSEEEALSKNRRSELTVEVRRGDRRR